MKKIILLILTTISISCGIYRTTQNGYKIKGSSKILFNGTDVKLNEKSIISGFVYSKDTKEFIEYASVIIGNQNVLTDKKGFFIANIEPGIYSVSANFIGNNKENITNLKVTKNNRVIILFELGTDVIQCK